MDGLAMDNTTRRIIEPELASQAGDYQASNIGRVAGAKKRCRAGE
jgi:hypothetical protein